MNMYTQMKSIADFNKKALLGALVAAGLTVYGAGVSAGTATQNLSVSAEITASCVFGTAATLPFGTLGINDLTNGKNEETPASVKITCTNTGTAAKLYAGATRQMTDGATGALNYEVYTNGGRSAALGTAAGSGIDVTANGTEQTITLYGRMAGGQQTQPAGTYTQNLLLTVEF